MSCPEELKVIYTGYETALEKAYKKASPLAGVFHSGADDPRRDACNQIFDEAVESYASEMAKSDPAPEEIAEIVRWILFYPAEHRDAHTYWYSYAAQRHTAGLISGLNQSDAAEILALYQKYFPKERRLPAQEELLHMLKKQAKAADAQISGSWLSVWGTRVVLLLIGLTIAHLGVTLFLLADLGSDPFNVMIQGIFRRNLIPVTHGTIHAVVSFLIILVLLAVDRSYIRIGTFLCMLLGGPIIDAFSLLFGGIINGGSPMALRILAVVLGCGILAFGMTIVIKSQAGTGPNDLVAVVISEKSKAKFGIVRIAVDLVFALVGFALGGTIGIGTVICMAVVGPVAQIFMPISEKICGKFLK